MLNGKKSVILGSGPVIISTCLDCIAVLCAISVIRCCMSEWIFAYADEIARLGLYWVCSANVVAELYVEVCVLLDPSLCHVCGHVCVPGQLSGPHGASKCLAG